MMTREQSLSVLHEHRGDDTVVVTTMGSAAPWSKLSNSSLDFPSVGSAMGHAADFAMGIALAQPDRQVWVLNGDGSMLMSLGTMVTICQTPAANLVLFVLQNNTFEVTGNQPIPGANIISMVQMAKGAGFSQVHEFDSPDSLRAGLPAVLVQQGPIFINLPIEPGTEPAPKLPCSLSVPAAHLRTAIQP